MKYVYILSIKTTCCTHDVKFMSDDKDLSLTHAVHTRTVEMDGCVSLLVNEKKTLVPWHAIQCIDLKLIGEKE